MNALQTVEAAGKPIRIVRGLLQQQAEAERDHDQREVAKASNDEARDIADDARGDARDQQPRQRLAPSPHGNQAGRVGTDAEIGGVAERDDAGEAKDEIERQRKQRGNRHLARQQQIIGRQHERQQRREPERDLAPVPACLCVHKFVRSGRRRGSDG